MDWFKKSLSKSSDSEAGKCFFCGDECKLKTKELRRFYSCQNCGAFSLPQCSSNEINRRCSAERDIIAEYLFEHNREYRVAVSFDDNSIDRILSEARAYRTRTHIWRVGDFFEILMHPVYSFIVFIVYCIGTLIMRCIKTLTKLLKKEN